MSPRRQGELVGRLICEPCGFQVGFVEQRAAGLALVWDDHDDLVVPIDTDRRPTGHYFDRRSFFDLLDDPKFVGVDYDRRIVCPQCGIELIVWPNSAAFRQQLANSRGKSAKIPLRPAPLG